MTEPQAKVIIRSIQELTIPLVEPNTKATGRRTNSTAMVRKPGPTRLSTRENIVTVKNTERESSSGRTTVAMRAISTRTTSTASASMSGQTAGSTRGSGRTTKWKAEEFSLGSMEEGTRASIKTIRRRVLECSLSEMAGSMRVNGKMVSSMARGYSRRKMCRDRVFGKMERGSSGSTK